MDKIEFRKTKIEYGVDGDKNDAVNIFVNGRNLLDDIHRYEKKFHIAGGHTPITTYKLYENLAEDHLKQSVPIYGCGCGIIDCCPVYISVKIDDKFVIWNNFKFGNVFINDDNKFKRLIFDREQYFAEIENLKKMTFENNLKIEYGEIIMGGMIKLSVKKYEQNFDFWFFEYHCDPIPKLVELLNFIQKGENVSKLDFMDELNYYENKVAFQISVWHSLPKKVWLTLKIFDNDIVFHDVYLRDELEEMLKKIFSDLLNDEKFPYFYPVSDCYDEDSFDDALELAENMAENIPNLNDEERFAKEEEFFLQMMKEGKVKLVDSYKKFLEKYKKMLTDYIIPKTWF